MSQYVEDINEGIVLVVAVREKDVYGNTLFYPNNTVATILCQIANKKTLLRRDLDQLDASFNFVVKVDSASANPWTQVDTSIEGSA